MLSCGIKFGAAISRCHYHDRINDHDTWFIVSSAFNALKPASHRLVALLTLSATNSISPLPTTYCCPLANRSIANLVYYQLGAVPIRYNTNMWSVTNINNHSRTNACKTVTVSLVKKYLQPSPNPNTNTNANPKPNP